MVVPVDSLLVVAILPIFHKAPTFLHLHQTDPAALIYTYYCRMNIINNSEERHVDFTYQATCRNESSRLLTLTIAFRASC